MTRVPSLYFLQALLAQQTTDVTSLYRRGVDPECSYYVLNPESNIPNTEEKFAAMFAKYV